MLPEIERRASNPLLHDAVQALLAVVSDVAGDRFDLQIRVLQEPKRFPKPQLRLIFANRETGEVLERSPQVLRGASKVSGETRERDPIAEMLLNVLLGATGTFQRMHVVEDGYKSCRPPSKRFSGWSCKIDEPFVERGGRLELTMAQRTIPFAVMAVKRLMRCVADMHSHIEQQRALESLFNGVVRPGQSVHEVSRA